MRSRIIVAALLVAALSAGTVATSGDRVAPTRQWAVAYLNEPTLIGTTIVEGPVLFVYDMDKMAPRKMLFMELQPKRRPSP